MLLLLLLFGGILAYSCSGVPASSSVVVLIPRDQRRIEMGLPRGQPSQLVSAMEEPPVYTGGSSTFVQKPATPFAPSAPSAAYRKDNMGEL